MLIARRYRLQVMRTAEVEKHARSCVGCKLKLHPIGKLHKYMGNMNNPLKTVGLLTVKLTYSHGVLVPAPGDTTLRRIPGTVHALLTK